MIHQCKCGCGKPTRIATNNDSCKGWLKGKPLRYLKGHNLRAKSRTKTSRIVIVDGVLCRTIPLTQRLEAIVDLADYSMLSQHIWAATSRSPVYAFSTIDGKPTKMHSLLIAIMKGIELDHRNGNGLDNRRSNLRMATKTQNHANRRKHRGSSRFKGVNWKKERSKWRAGITVKGQIIFLGYFESEELAAGTYDVAARRYFGKFACLNFPKDGEQGCLARIA